MKYVIMSFVFIVVLMVVLKIISVPSIDIRNAQGTVISVEKCDDHYKIKVKCQCLHTRLQSSFVIHTPNNYKVGI